MKPTTFTCPQTGLVRDWAKERERDNARSAAIAGAVRDLRELDIQRICARYELEPDEFQTREEKALKYL